MADHLGFKVQRLKGDQCRLLMPNVEVSDTLTNIEFTDTLANIEASLRKAAEEELIPTGGRKNPDRLGSRTGGVIGATTGPGAGLGSSRGNPGKQQSAFYSYPRFKRSNLISCQSALHQEGSRNGLNPSPVLHNKFSRLLSAPFKVLCLVFPTDSIDEFFGSVFVACCNLRRTLRRCVVAATVD
jgi:hypothetical protein